MTNLKTTTARSKLAPRGKPYFVPTTTPGIALGYRRLDGRPGSWTARVADGQGGNRLQVIGIADDAEAANGRDVLSYEQAADKARTITRAPTADGLTVTQALADYEAADANRDPRNVGRVRFHLVGNPILTRDVTALTAPELAAWRDGIKAQPATVNRTVRILKAALSRAAERFPDQVTNTSAWTVGLRQVKHKHEANNVVLTDDEVRALVVAAYGIDAAFGLLVEVLAVTGARVSQVTRIEVRDLQADKCRVMIPTSAKGTGSKKSHIAVPVTEGLARKLQVAAAGRGAGEPLLLRTKGDAWNAENADYRGPFERAVRAAGLDEEEVTSYALRHSSIVRRIILGVPLREIAGIHDTSVVMIERNYSRDIDLHGGSVRVGLIEVDTVTRDNVVALVR